MTNHCDECWTAAQVAGWDSHTEVEDIYERIVEDCTHG